MIDWGTGVLLAVMLVIGANHAVMRFAALRANRWVFWTLQGFNLVVASAVMLLGIPGLETFPIVKWFVGLLLLFHILQNNNHRVTALRQSLKDREADERREANRKAFAAMREREEAEARAGGPSNMEPEPETSG